MIQIPLILLKKLYDEALNKIRADLTYYVTNDDEENSWLYRVFGDNEIDGYNFYVQAKSILLRGDKDPKKIQTRLLFNPAKSNSPVIYFNEPSEDSGAQDWIGVNRDDSFFHSDTQFSDKLGRSYKSVYEIVVMSNNNTETIMIYNLLKALTISLKSSLSHYFNTYSVGGRQLMDMSTLMPEYFYKSIVLMIDYSISVPDINSTQNYDIDDDLNFEGFDVNEDKIFDETFDNTFE